VGLQGWRPRVEQVGSLTALQGGINQNWGLSPIAPHFNHSVAPEMMTMMVVITL